jgi:DNA invertase Pin-like site-specific DNA recombinase
MSRTRRPAAAATTLLTRPGQRCVIYLRLSDLDDADLNDQGEAKTFGARESAVRELAARHGWTVVDVIIENDVARREGGKQRNASAFKRRKITQADGSVIFRVIRPGFQRIVRGIADGTYDALLTEDLDRTMRDPYDCEDLIAAVRTTKANARSVSSSLTLTDGGTDSEITMARFLVTIANKSSLDTSRRVAEGRERKARANEFGGGPRRFGFESDGITKRWDECMIINVASHRVLKIDGRAHRAGKLTSLRLLAAELRAAEVPTVTGAAWTAATLRDILLRPRNAGIMEHRGEEIGPAPWLPIVPEPVFRAVVRVLTDPSRRTNAEQGATPRWQGSGIYRCGICDDGTTCWVSGGKGRSPRYACKGKNHLTRNAERLDLFVRDVIIERLSRPDAAEVFTVETGPAVDARALHAEAAAIRDGLNELAADRGARIITREQYLHGIERGNNRLEEINTTLAASVEQDSPVLPLLAARDVAAAWDAQPLAIKRAVIDTMVTVKIHPSGQRGSGFYPETIEIRPKVPTRTRPDVVVSAAA